ncbi:hypothetical protein [Polycladidibacter hongkongensis]|uniref:hypothetical protein n=1 Tax=Polycladidibacter hongkongensis TaxID=1647556 RepID=UPI000832AE5B|nr:hypothetical protein [Pseudovibrio hongkongensis]
MRASSTVLTHLQTPPTIFGMPPLFAILLFCGVFVEVVVFRMIGGNALAFGVVLVSVPPAIGYSIYLRRQDPHCETMLTLPTGFYRGKGLRVLVAGLPATKDKKRRAKK